MGRPKGSKNKNHKAKEKPRYTVKSFIREAINGFKLKKEK